MDFVNSLFQGKKPENSRERFTKVSLEYSYEDIKAATNGFDAKNRLGAGAYGAVYKGTLKSGTVVAIKEMDTGATEAGTGFEEEVTTLSKFRHPNLVTLMGWGRQGGKRFLLYELLEGGDVCERLGKCKKGVPFTWKERLSVALDACSGLSHMHNSEPKAFHRDIKSANIILDRNGNAKMADFGLSGTIKGASKKHLTVANISGTPGYACPAYIQTGRVSEQSEVYSFGMVLFELLLNKAPALMGPQGDIMYPILQDVQPACPGALERCQQQLDPAASWPALIGTELAEAALTCVDQPERRPAFADLVRFLRHLNEGGSGRRMMPNRGSAQGPGGGGASGGYAQPSQVANELFELAEVILECTHADGVDLASFGPLSPATMVLQVKGPGGSLHAQVGRQHQSDLFEDLVKDKAALGCISRNHFELSWNPPAGPLLLNRISANALFLNGEVTPEKTSVPVQQGSEIAFSSDGTPDGNRCLRFSVAFRDRSTAAAQGPHPALTRKPSGAARTSARGSPGPTLAVLEAIEVADMDLQQLPPEAKKLGFDLLDTAYVGRNYQTGFFEGLLQKTPEYQSFISRAHFQLAPAGPDWTELQLTNLSANVVFIDGKPLGKDKTGVIPEGGILGFAAALPAAAPAPEAHPAAVAAAAQGPTVALFLKFRLRKAGASKGAGKGITPIAEA